mmetsp:Transcript_5114/g.16360  ORF Transcript_5114/g.16360 Transcript_5114/m.16360 type:complete len:244 (+) Transcript_5114:2887-3618(+)
MKKKKRFHILLSLLIFSATIYFLRDNSFEGKSLGSSGKNLVEKSDTFFPHSIRATATKTGAWKLPSGYEYYFDEPLARAMVQYFKKEKKSWGRPEIVEFGSGTGKYIDYFRSNKIIARGYDGVSDILVRSNGVINHVDLTEQINVGSAEFVVCLEVAEHIPKKFEEIFLRNILTHCEQSIILSWAPPSQSGVGHVNTKERDDVIELLSIKGYHVNEAATNLLGGAATLPWFKENLMVFKKKSA